MLPSRWLVSHSARLSMLEVMVCSINRSYYNLARDAAACYLCGEIDVTRALTLTTTNRETMPTALWSQYVSYLFDRSPMAFHKSGHFDVHRMLRRSSWHGRPHFKSAIFGIRQTRNSSAASECQTFKTVIWWGRVKSLICLQWKREKMAQEKKQGSGKNGT